MRPYLEEHVLAHLPTSADEPVFIVRAQDVTAVNTVLYWIHEATRVGVKSEKIAAASKVAADMLQWQRANMGRVKIPD
jgi:hypothetical protein